MKPTKRKDGRYMLTKQVNGVSKYFYDITAKGCVSQYNNWNGSASSLTPCGIELDAWIDKEVSTRSRATQAQYKAIMIKHIKPVIGKLPLSKVIPFHCQTIINKMHNIGLSGSTMRHAKKVMHTFFEYERNIKKTINVNPCTDIKIPESTNTRARRSASTDELQLIWERTQKTHYYNCFRFLLITGLRPSEACGIRIDHITGNKIHIEEARTRYDVSNGKTKHANRIIEISPAMLVIINEQLLYLREHFQIKPEYLFPNEAGHPANSGLLSRAWFRIVPEVSSLSLYELRHTFVSLMINNMPIKELQAYIGHSSRMDTSTTYAHIFSYTNQSDKIDEQIGGFMSPKVKPCQKSCQTQILELKTRAE